MVTDSAGRGGRRLDRLEVVFDDDRVVANAGVLLAATLADRLGVERLVDESVSLADRSAGSRAGAKVLSLVHVPEREAAKKRAERRGGEHTMAQHATRLADTEHVTVVDRVSTEQHRVHQRQHFRARPRARRAIG
jgi:hypothetical protein